MTSKKYELSETEAWRLYKLLEEMNDFLHGIGRQGDAKRVEEWLQRGIYAELHHAYYNIVGPWFPVDDDTGEVNGPTE